MITVTRALLRQLRTALRKAGIHKAKAEKNPPIALVANPTGLYLRAKSLGGALEYYDRQQLPSETIWLPGMFVDDCEGSQAEIVTVEALTNGCVTAQFRDKNIPQLLQYDAVPDADKAGEFPALPNMLARNEADLLPALIAAAETSDGASSRYALSNLQIDGTNGILEATDGRHFLRQSGFSFPWRGQVLVPASKFFAWNGLPTNQSVEVGKFDHWALFRIAPWTLWLPIDGEGRYPKTADLVPSAAAAKSSCRLSAADADFLVRAIEALPGDKEGANSVTLDLNGQVAVRSKASHQPEATEILLTKSIASGEPIRVGVHRHYLARAARLGLRDFHFYGAEAPVLCCDERRSYVWAAVTNGVVAPSPNPIRIESSPEATVAPASHPATFHEESAVSTTRAGNETPTEQAALGRSTNKRLRGHTAAPITNNLAAMERAQALRVALRQALAENKELIRALQRQQRQARLVANTLDSLKQLKVA